MSAEEKPAAPPLWDVNDVAEYAKVSVHTVRGWVARGRVPYLKVAGNVRFDADQVVAWSRSREGSMARHPREGALS